MVAPATETPQRSTPEPASSGNGDIQWRRCPSCSGFVYLRRLQRHNGVCPECSHHIRICVSRRLSMLLDEGSFQRFDADMESVDVLSFTDSKPYPARLASAKDRTGSNEAVTWGTGTIGGYAIVVAAMDFDFLGGSIGGVVGELISRAARTALRTRTPLLLISASGGARMQEGTVSLMQLAKTSQEIGRLREAGVLTINLNTDPTYGGATASFSMLGDIIIAEPGARIGFAGPQVIKQTIRQDLPAGFQTAEFLLEHGMIDMVVPRDAQRLTLTRLLALHTKHQPEDAVGEGTLPLTNPVLLGERVANDVVAMARNIQRPTTLDYCRYVFDDFMELHGDRISDDDPAIVAGVAKLNGQPVVVVGQQKGHDPAELVRRNFGMPQPAGYHKARRFMDYADRFGFPLVTFVDTAGAYPGIEAEKLGQGTAIAECILRMSRLRVPTVVLVTGEGGSGGALAIGVGNHVLMLENAYLSVISPEGCATILWGSATAAERAAEVLRITAPDLLRLGIADAVVPEPAGGASTDHQATAQNVRAAIQASLADLSTLDGPALVDQRYSRIARFGDPACQPVLGREVTP